jgi:hypothetical protein
LKLAKATSGSDPMPFSAFFTQTSAVCASFSFFFASAAASAFFLASAFLETGRVGFDVWQQNETKLSEEVHFTVSQHLFQGEDVAQL